MVMPFASARVACNRNCISMLLHVHSLSGHAICLVKPGALPSIRFLYAVDLPQLPQQPKAFGPWLRSCICREWTTRSILVVDLSSTSYACSRPVIMHSEFFHG